MKKQKQFSIEEIKNRSLQDHWMHGEIRRYPRDKDINKQKKRKRIKRKQIK